MISSTADGVRVSVRVVPRAGRSGIAGTRDGALLVRLHAAPVDGAANAELVEVIAKAAGVARRQVAIDAGERSRLKVVRITGVPVDELAGRLGCPLPTPR